MTDPELLREFKERPSATALQPFLDRYGSLVYGCALRQVGEEQGAGEVMLSTFQAFAARARKLPKKINAAGWLFRAAHLSAKALNRKRKVQISKPPLRTAPILERSTYVLAVVDDALDRLSPKYRDPILLRLLLQWDVDQTSKELRIDPAKVQKRVSKGLEKLTRRLKKIGLPALELAGIVSGGIAQPPEALLSSIAAGFEQTLAERPKTELVQAIFRGLAWIRWKRRLRLAFRAVAIFIAILVSAGALVAYLARTGRLTAMFIEWGSRNIAKQVPEAAKPARPWPEDPARPSPVAAKLAGSADLYRMTNVWRANLRFAEDQWKQIEPKRIPPVRDFMRSDGGVNLRNPAARRNGLSGVLGYEFDWVHAGLEFGGQDFASVAARFKGNGTYIGSLYGQKRSFKVELNKYTKGQSVGGVHTINFLNMIEDPSCVHDALGYELFRESGVPAPRTAYAWLTVDVPGKWNKQPLGLYLLVENLDADFALDRFGSKKVPIFKPVTYDLFKDLGNDWSAYAKIYDLKTKATDAQTGRVIEFARFLTHTNDVEFAKRIGEFLDLDEFARFVGGMVLESSYDGFLSNGQNFYMYLDPRSNKFGFIPWDLDHSWGEFGFVGKAEDRDTASIWKPWAYPNRLLQRVMKVEEFRKIYRARLETMLATTFSPEHLFQRIDEMRPVVRPPTEAESPFRMHRMDQATSTNWLSSPRDGEFTGPKRPVHQLKRFITNRAKSVRDQLDGKSEGTIMTWGRR